MTLVAGQPRSEAGSAARALPPAERDLRAVQVPGGGGGNGGNGPSGGGRRGNRSSGESPGKKKRACQGG